MTMPLLLLLPSSPGAVRASAAVAACRCCCCCCTTAMPCMLAVNALSTLHAAQLIWMLLVFAAAAI